MSTASCVCTSSLGSRFRLAATRQAGEQYFCQLFSGVNSFPHHWHFIPYACLPSYTLSTPETFLFMIWENISFLTFHFLRLWITVLKFLFRHYYPPRISSMPKLTDHYILKRYMGNGYISKIASIGSFLSPTSWVVSCLLLVIWITTTIPSKKGMWRNESPFLHIPFLLCFHLVQGSRFSWRLRRLF